MKELKLDKEKALKIIKSFKVEADLDSYQKSYPSLLNFFKANIGNEINRDSFIIGAHMVYGWMPTILELHNGNITIDEACDLTKRFGKDPESICAEDINNLASIINGSVIGTSKLLHFIYPELFPIWDSRIYWVLKEGDKPYPNEANKPALYLRYYKIISDLIKNEDIILKLDELIYLYTARDGGYSISRLRALELCIFSFAPNLILTD